MSMDMDTFVTTRALLGLWLLGLLVYCCCAALYRLFFHPLASVPGPKLAALTRWYEAYFDLWLDGQYTFKIRDLHRQYGPIIRISPFEIHINDPAFYEQLYRHDGKWNKYDWTMNAFGVPNAMVCTIDHSLHRIRRAPLNPYFARSVVHSQQNKILARVDRLCERIDEFAKQGAVINIATALGALSTDVATEYCLTRSYENLERSDFNQDMANIISFGSGSVWRFAKHFPWVDALFKTLMPLWLVEKIGSPEAKAFVQFLNTCKDQTSQIRSTISSKPIAGDPPTMIHAIMQSNLPQSEKTLPRLQDEVATVVGAGLETVVAPFRCIIYNVFKDPRILKHLREEVQDLPADASVAQMEKLPYLTAVIREGLRLAPGIASRLQRISAENIVYDRWNIPAGTPVGMTHLLMHLDERVYREPKLFNPERWLLPGGQVRKTDATFAPFSRGSRICLGMHIAWAELYAGTARLVQRFDLRLVDTTDEEVEVYNDSFVVGVKSKNGVRVIATRTSSS